MRFQCSHCGSVNLVEDACAGQAVNCSACGKAVAVPAGPLSPGTVIADFVIKGKIGSGGSNTSVYLAHQMSLDRSVALKILEQNVPEQKEHADQLLREARAAARLTHSAIVQAYAAGEEEGLCYFAMEYVEGTTLLQILRQAGRMVVDRALVIVEQIAEGMDYAWKKEGLVHKDIKPSNIILTKEGETKLADLGLASCPAEKIYDPEETVVGTPQYMAPEHFQGQDMDCRTDIYSLGATLYHMLTGTYPYTAPTASETAMKHLTTPLTVPEAVVSDIPEAVSLLVQGMLAKRAEHRYNTAAELIKDIKRVRKGDFPAKQLAENAQEPLAVEEDEETDSQMMQSSDVAPDGEQADAGKSDGTSTAAGSGDGKGNGMNKKDSRLKLHRGKSDKGDAAVGDTAGDQQAPGAGAVALGSMTSEAGEVAAHSAPNATPQEPVPDESGSEGSGSGAVGVSSKDHGDSKKKIVVSGIAGGVVLVVGLAVLFVYPGFFVAPGDDQNGKQTSSAADKTEEQDQNRAEKERREKTLDEIKRLVADGQRSTKILQRAEKEISQAQGQTTYIASIRRVVRPVMEDEIRAQRVAQYERRLQDWKERADELSVAHLQEKAERQRTALQRMRNTARDVNAQKWGVSHWERAESLREKGADAFKEGDFVSAAANWREAQSALRKAEQAGKEKNAQKQALQQEYDSLRWQSIQHCRENNYREAKQLFLGLKTSDFPECRDWAEQQMNMINHAQEVVNTVAGTHDQLSGKNFGDEEKGWEVAYIGSSDVELRLVETQYKDGEWVTRTREKRTIPLKDVPAPRMWDLYKMVKLGEAKGKEGTPEMKFKFAVYLLCRAKTRGNLEQARSFLNAYGQPPFREVLKEVDKARTIITERNWTDSLDRLQLWVNQGKVERAKRFAEYLKTKYPDKYRENKQKINEMLPN